MFWKIYFYVLVLVSLSDIILRLVWPNSRPNWYSVTLVVIFEAAALVGLYGFAYSKRIFKPVFWRVFLAVGILYEVKSIFDDIQLSKKIDPEMFSLLSVVADVAIYDILLLPFFVGIFLYAFRSKELWQS